MVEPERGAQPIVGDGAPLGRPTTAPAEVTLFPRFVERAAVGVFAIEWLGCMLLLALAWIPNPELHHGDSFSDANVLNAGGHFDRFGLSLNCGLPTHQATPAPGRPVPPYTHYPPGPEWVHQALKALGLRELWQFRAVSLAVTCLTLLLLMIVTSRITGSRVIGALCVFFYCWSLPFTEYADSLHQFAYVQLTLMLVLVAWVAYERAARRAARRGWLALAAVSFFIDLWLSFEHVLLIPGVVLGRTLFVQPRRNWRGTLLLLLIPPVVLATRVAHNSFALGSIRAAASDLFGAAHYRGGLDGESSSWRDLSETWQRRLGAGGRAVTEYDRQMSYGVLRPEVRIPAALLTMLVLCLWHVDSQRSVAWGVSNGLLLLVAGALWVFVMKQHACMHRHLIMLLLPGLALLLASLTGAGLAQTWRAPAVSPMRWCGPLLAFALLVGFGWQMRFARALNLLVPVNRQTSATLANARENIRLERLARERFADVAHIYFVGGMYPEFAYRMGRPYTLAQAPLPARLGPHDVVWIEQWSDEEKRLAWQAFQRFGFPDTFSAPHNNTLVFRGHTEGVRPVVDIAYEGGARVVDLRFAPTLDGESYVLQALIEPPPDKAALDRLIHAVQVLDQDGTAVANVDARLSWAMPRGERLVVCHWLPRKWIVPGVRLRISLWNDDQGRALRPVIEQAVLPPGATWEADGLSYLWELPVTGGSTPRG